MIDRTTIEQLARLFERYNDAFDPESSEAKESEVEFDREAERLFDRVSAAGIKIQV